MDPRRLTDAETAGTCPPKPAARWLDASDWPRRLRYWWKRRAVLIISPEPIHVRAGRLARASLELAAEAEGRRDPARAARYRASAQRFTLLAEHERARG